MILDGKDIGKLQGKGAKVLKNEKQVKSDTDYLREISNKLSQILNKSEVHHVEMSAPVVNVPAPIVNIEASQEEKDDPKQWKFDLKKNDKGQTTEIIATAIG